MTLTMAVWGLFLLGAGVLIGFWLRRDWLMFQAEQRRLDVEEEEAEYQRQLFEASLQIHEAFHQMDPPRPHLVTKRSH